MTLTYVEVRRALNRRLGPWSALADAPEAIGYAMRYVGVDPASLESVTDAEIQQVPDAYVNAMMDIAEYRALSTIITNAEDQEMNAAGLQGDPSKLREALERRVAKLLQQIKSAYNFGLMPLSGGVWTLDFASQDDPIPTN